jgi:prepilin-type N-terminal cleavage/methylation domain-containing protein
MDIFKSEKGVTLLEVLVSITILSIVLISFITMFPQMGLMNKTNADKSQAVNTAKDLLNEWKTNPDIINALKSGTPWPIEPVITSTPQNYHLFLNTNPNAEIRIWKEPEKGFNDDTDLINAYKIQVQVKNDRDLVISENYGYVIVKKEMIINAE